MGSNCPENRSLGGSADPQPLVVNLPIRYEALNLQSKESQIPSEWGHLPCRSL